MLQALKRQIEAELGGEDRDKDVFVFIVDKVNTGALNNSTVESSSKLRTRLSSKAAPFVPKPAPEKDLQSSSFVLKQLVADDNDAGTASLQASAERSSEDSGQDMTHMETCSTTTGIDDDDLPVGSSTEESGTLTMPVKRTFIHYPVSADISSTTLKRCSSAPEIMIRTPFTVLAGAEDSDEEEEQMHYGASQQTVLEKVLAHERGECRPCAFYCYKQDGCRWGDKCNFCHLCPKGEIKVRRKMMRYATQRAVRGLKHSGAAASHSSTGNDSKNPKARILLLDEQGTRCVEGKEVCWHSRSKHNKAD
eukprot:CAMPEP_0178406348 /NCGR_PEP_ID=MMETSP0689_2-20121128/18866_1 /TAXON_ID=160604 /ORGANISM="Amphidinium massartii, Strain CS-259" /LENGTH=306 /DNA_ID=CAMNT_0020027387 /DNA_START=81 /DNA_END=998 /DNA_ORIENTATION=-